jgi:hypothetical protein
LQSPRVFRFANVWQIQAGFAEHLQNVSRARQVVLPMLGKFGPFLPNIGKTARRRKRRHAQAETPQSKASMTLSD